MRGFVIYITYIIFLWQLKEVITWAGHAAHTEKKKKIVAKPNAKTSLAICRLICE